MKKIVLKLSPTILNETYLNKNKQWIEDFAKTIFLMKQYNNEVILIISKFEVNNVTSIIDLLTNTLAHNDLECSVLNINKTKIESFAGDVNQYIDNLLQQNIIPIITEDNLKEYDADMLSSHVARMCNADLQVLLCEINGLYDYNPLVDAEAERYPIIFCQDTLDEIIENNQISSSKHPNLYNKIKATKFSCSAGINVLMINAQDHRKLLQDDSTTSYGTLIIA